MREDGRERGREGEEGRERVVKNKTERERKLSWNSMFRM
jgi:hypothetical protein